MQPGADAGFDVDVRGLWMLTPQALSDHGHGDVMKLERLRESTLDGCGRLRAIGTLHPANVAPPPQRVKEAAG